MSDKKKDTAQEEPEIEPAETTEEVLEDVETVVEPVVEKEEPLRDQLLRLKADFDNFRKRTQRERSELFLFANESIFQEMLPVIDHFEMGLKSAEDHQTECSVTEGFNLVYNQLLDLLKKFNVTPVNALDEIFNPHQHEALTHMPSEKPSETVIEVFRKGYMMGDKLLRAAQVVVSSGSAEEESPKEEKLEA